MGSQAPARRVDHAPRPRARHSAPGNCLGRTPPHLRLPRSMPHHRSLAGKLSLLLAVPLIGLVFLTGRNIAGHVAIVRQQTALEGAATFLNQAGDLVHELQKERGRSAGFLGSKGTKFADAWTSTSPAGCAMWNE